MRPLPAWQPCYLYLTNPTDAPHNLIVELNAAETCTKKLVAMPRQTQKVTFEGPPAKPGDVLPELRGPLRIRVLDAERLTTVAERQISVSIASPREYARVEQVEFQPQSCVKNRFSITLSDVAAANNPAQSQARLPGPPSTAELVLTPDRIPGLLGVQGGVRRGLLPASGAGLQLVAENLQLAPAANEQGYAYITIDGCPRAMVFRTTFSRQGDPTTPVEDIRPSVRLRSSRFGRAGPDFAVTVEADYAPAGASLEVSLGTGQGDAFEPQIVRKLDTPQQRRVGLSPFGPGGALLFEAALRDWTVPLDTTGILGERLLRARILGEDGKVIAAAIQPVVLDDSPPEAQLTGLPPQAAKTAPLAVQAMARDELSGIAEVQFFVGKPADGKLPAGVAAVPGQPIDAARTLWTAELPLTAAQGSTAISAQFTNGVGLSCFATATVDVVAAVPAATGKIIGKVLEGPRPQAGLEVILKDDKGTELVKARTGPDGTFSIEKVPPGKYVLACEKPASQRKGSASVTVAPGTVASVQLELTL
jgi:hypothetical protein